MLQSINQSRLCNGSRFEVKKLMNTVIEATIYMPPVPVSEANKTIHIRARKKN
jgi:hypothetical protein